MAPAYTLNRRTVARLFAASPLAPAFLVGQQTTRDAQSTPVARDPLVQAMQPVTISTDPLLIQERQEQVGLNLTDYTQAEAQNCLDLAMLHTFNIMDANKDLINAGQYATTILQNEVIPEGWNIEEYAARLQTAPIEEIGIPFWFYPEWATDRTQSEVGVLDPRQGAEWVFVQEPGFYDIMWLGEQLNYAFSPRLAENNKLRLDIYLAPELYAEQLVLSLGDDPDEVRDVYYSYTANNVLQHMAYTFGSTDLGLSSVNDPNLFYFNKIGQIPPFALFPEIASQISGIPIGQGSYWFTQIGTYPLHVEDASD